MSDKLLYDLDGHVATITYMPRTEAIRFGETMRRLVGSTNDAAEGIAAAREKRPPAWTGT